MAGKNPWTAFLKQWMKSHPGKSLRDSMKLASADYKKRKGKVKPKKGRKKKSQK